MRGKKRNPKFEILNPKHPKVEQSSLQGSPEPNFVLVHGQILNSKFQTISIVAGIFFFDQLSKFLAPRLGFEIVYNRGIAFGLFPDFVWIIILPLVLLLTVVFKRCFSPHIPLFLIFSGGLSNFIDRLAFGAVRDWISLPLIPVFNLADLAINLGFLLLACNLLKCHPAEILPPLSGVRMTRQNETKSCF